MRSINRIKRSLDLRVIYKSNFRFSQQGSSTKYSFKSFIEAPETMETKNGFRATKLVFKINEKFKRSDLKKAIKMMYWTSLFAGIGAGYVYFLSDEPIKSLTLVALSVGNLLTGYRLNKMNDAFLAESSKLLQQAQISADGQTLTLHDMVQDSAPFTCKVSEVQYVKFSEGTEKQEDDQKKEVQMKYGLIELNLKTRAKEEKTSVSKPFFIKAYFGEDSTLIPNLGLFKAVLRGDAEEVKKYDLAGKEAELGNDFNNCSPEETETKPR